MAFNAIKRVSNWLKEDEGNKPIYSVNKGDEKFVVRTVSPAIDSEGYGRDSILE